MDPVELPLSGQVRRAEIMKAAESTLDSTYREWKSDTNQSRADSRETVRNLTIVAGAFATGALVLLGNNTNANTFLVVTGVVIIMLEVFVAFAYLFYAQHLQAVHSKSFFNEEIVPLVDLLDQYQDLQDGKMQDVEFDQKLFDYARARKTKLNTNRKNVRDATPTVNEWDKIFIAILGAGIVFIVVGLLAPYL